MALLDQSATHASARVKQLLSGGHCNGPAAATSHQAVAAYTSPTTSKAVGSRRASRYIPPLLGSVVSEGMGKRMLFCLFMASSCDHALSPTSARPRFLLLDLPLSLPLSLSGPRVVQLPLRILQIQTEKCSIPSLGNKDALTHRRAFQDLSFRLYLVISSRHIMNSSLLSSLLMVCRLWTSTYLTYIDHSLKFVDANLRSPPKGR